MDIEREKREYVKIHELKIREILEESVKKNITEGILLSAGLDTSILAYLGRKYNENLKAFTLKFKESSDEKYSKKLCEILDIEHHVLDIDEENLIKNLWETIKILGVFDTTEIRNSVAIYSILKFSKGYVNSVMTGDGADELFFGYDFLIKMDKKERENYAKKMYNNMHFASMDIGNFFGIKIFQPYLSDEVKNYAISLDDDLKINNGVGKWILRSTYKNLLPEDFIMRKKAPIEYGSGTTLLSGIFESRISDEDFIKSKLKYNNEDRVVITTKEHLYYYQIYKEIFGSVKKAKENEIMCTGCGAKIEHEHAFCRICGMAN